MPTLALPSLVGSAGEAVDGAAPAFLTSRALAAQEEEAQKQAQVRKLEERMRRQRREALVQEIDALFAVPAWCRSDEEDSRIEMLASELRLLDSASSSSQPGRRKRKKKRSRPSQWVSLNSSTTVPTGWSGTQC